MRHKLKIWPEYFEKVCSGVKKFEIRKDDRNFQVNDILELMEFEPGSQKYSGDYCNVLVTYIIRGPAWDLPKGMVVMSIDVLSESRHEVQE